MITIIKKDITTITSGIIAHGVNCQGAMGSGVAGAIRNKWERVYTEYKQFCNTLRHPTDALGIVQTVNISNDIIVANCFTQERYGSDGKKYADPSAINEALDSIYNLAFIKNLPIYLPKIGCGLGGLNWEQDIHPMLLELDISNTRHYVHEFDVFVCDI